MTDLERRALLLAALPPPLAAPEAAAEPPGHDMGGSTDNWVKHKSGRDADVPGDTASRPLRSVLFRRLAEPSTG